MLEITESNLKDNFHDWFFNFKDNWNLWKIHTKYPKILSLGLILYMHEWIVLNFWSLKASHPRKFLEIWLISHQKEIIRIRKEWKIKMSNQRNKVELLGIFWQGLLKETKSLEHFLDAHTIKVLLTKMVHPVGESIVGNCVVLWARDGMGFPRDFLGRSLREIPKKTHAIPSSDEKRNILFHLTWTNGLELIFQ
jgi:hypothetical protein